MRIVVAYSDSHHQFAHAHLHWVVFVVHVCQHWRRTVGPVEPWCLEIAHHVVQDVAVENPVSRSFRRPCHIERVAASDGFRHNHPPFRGCVGELFFSIANCIDVEVETVEVHWVSEWSRIHNAPVFGLTDTSVQPFSVWPGFAVERKYTHKTWSKQALGPRLDHKGAVVPARSRVINDEGS